MSTFKTNPMLLKTLLKDVEEGRIKLPEFQRSWVWDEARIKSLVASVSMAFPIGAVMALETNGTVKFKDRPIEGTPESAKEATANLLILDGQQRITSLYQSCVRQAVVQTKTVRNKRIRRWFYIDMRKVLNPDADREEAIVGVPEDKIVRRDFSRSIKMDLSTRENEYRNFMFPLNCVFDYNHWQEGFITFHGEFTFFFDFQKLVLSKFQEYSIPIIVLTSGTKPEAVCIVFEKVNTGGKPLDTFELVTAMYAARGFNLRDDWLGTSDAPGRRQCLRDYSRLLDGVSSTDFLQVVSLLHTNSLRKTAMEEGKTGQELPMVTAKRQSLLRLPLEAYQQHRDSAQKGLKEAAKFLHALGIFRVRDVPYRTQMIPLAAILAELGSHLLAVGREKLVKWYWSGVFGELYGSATESRSARDMVEVPAWIDNGDPPSTVREARFPAERLDALRTRNSAAYKGLIALLIMMKGVRDWRSGQRYNEAVVFDEAVDIHHIFPRHWCKEHGIVDGQINSIVNKTPLSSSTNRILGGDAPSKYLRRLENDTEMSVEEIDALLRTHVIDPEFLRSDDFDSFYDNRKSQLCSLIEEAMDKKVFWDHETGEPEEGREDLSATDAEED